MLQKIKSFLAQGNHAQWCVFLLFAFVLFIKCCLFQLMCFHSILISSLWKNPIEGCLCYLPKLAFSIMIASVIFITRRKYWTIYFSGILDIWCLANFIYYRSNEALIDNFALSMANNMNGFWSSIIFLIYPYDIILFLITLLYGLCFFLIDTRNTSWKFAVIGIFAGYILSLAGQYLYSQKEEYKGWYPLYYEPFSRKVRTNIDYTEWIRQTSILHSPACILVDYYECQNARNIKMLQTDKMRIESFITNSTNDKHAHSKYKIIVLLVESFENWAITPTIMPNLSTFMETHYCLQAPKIKKQTKAGTSMDGQMILNTGLLPISEGATCFLFPNNKFPSFAELMKSVTIIPHGINSWNQRGMSPAMHFDSTIVRSINDTLLAKTTLDCIHQGYQYVQTVTMASHMPFDYGEKHSELCLPSSMPKYMSNYLKSLNCTDAGFKILFDAFDADSCLGNTILVITGDHTVFTQENREEYAAFCKKYDLDYHVNEGFCPLIIYYPQTQENTQIIDTCYQMDIYPTILHLIGCEDYYWKGFGVNLMDSIARHNRPISEQEAYELSDKLIRSNYFANIDK